jgi:hypothetical protein
MALEPPDRSTTTASDRRHADDAQVAERVKLMAVLAKLLGPGLRGLGAGKLMDHHPVVDRRLALVHPELVAVVQGDALTAVAPYGL